MVRLFEETTKHRADEWQVLLCERLEKLSYQKSQRLLVHGPPQHGKPCSVKSMVLMGNGRYKELGDIVVGDVVISHTGQPRKVTAVHEQGGLPCVEIVTHHGRRTIAALDHPFLTPEGWTEAATLVPEQLLACVGEPKCQEDSTLLDSEFELAGYLIGDGSLSSNNCSITCNDPLQAERIFAVVEDLGFALRVAHKEGTTALTYALKGGARDWWRERGLWGHNAFTKVVPDWVYRGSAGQVAIFIGAYFSCDGTISPKGPDRSGNPRPDASVEFYSVNLELLRGVQRLLLRVGVQSRISQKNGRYNGERHESWRLSFSSQDNVAAFASRVPIPGVKGPQLKTLCPLRRTFPPSFLGDPVVAVLPVGLRECRCLTVEIDHTFTVDDLVVHNSILVSQRFPAFILGMNPAARIRLACYNVSHSIRFCVVNQVIMRDPAYLGMFPHPASRIPKRSPADHFSTMGRAVENDANPSFLALGLGTGFSGLGVDILVIDDPYKDALEAHSEATNHRLWLWWTDVVQGRLNPDTNIVVMFHRWWEDDFAGRLMEQGGWESMRFPAIADGGADDPTLAAGIRKTGESLTKRYPVKYLTDLRDQPGMQNTFASLWQGTPFPAEGNLFKRGRIGFVDKVPEGARYCRGWDVASTAGDGDETAGVLMALLGDKLYVVDVMHGHWGTDERNERMRETAFRDKQTYGHVIQRVPQDPASAGKDMALAFARLLRGFSVNIERIQGSKEFRADPYAAQWNAGDGKHSWTVALVDERDKTYHPWHDYYCHQMESFPAGKGDDLVDASSTSFNYLTQRGMHMMAWSPKRPGPDVVKTEDTGNLSWKELAKKIGRIK